MLDILPCALAELMRGRLKLWAWQIKFGNLDSLPGCALTRADQSKVNNQWEEKMDLSMRLGMAITILSLGFIAAVVAGMM